MIEKTQEEFLPGEFIADYCQSIDGVVYLRSVYQVKSILIDGPDYRDLNVVELAFGGKPSNVNGKWEFPTVYQKASLSSNAWKKAVTTISSCNTQLRQQLTEEEVLSLYRADLRRFNVRGALHI